MGQEGLRSALGRFQLPARKIERGREKQDRDLGGAGIRTEAPTDVEAVDVRKMDIEDDYSRKNIGGANGGQSGERLTHFESCVREHFGDGVRRRVMVFYNQNSRLKSLRAYHKGRTTTDSSEL